jgi:8-oxo-dGTP diphosphatase
VIPRTLIFLFNHREQVLLIKGSKEKRLWAGVLNGVGGHVEAGEDICEAAQRELAEETGIVNIQLTYCGQIMVDISKAAGVAIFLFRGEYLADDFINSEEGELMWVDLERLGDEHIVEDLIDLLPKIAEFQEGHPLIIGKSYYSEDGGLVISFR